MLKGGTAALAVLEQLLHALTVRGVLKPLDPIGILDLAAEKVEKLPDELGGQASLAAGATIRGMKASFEARQRARRRAPKRS